MGGSDVSPSVALRLALAGAWHVVRGRSLGQFPRVLGLLEAVGRAAPGAVRYRHGARLRLGLQAAVVVAMLREAQPAGRVLDAVDSFFPEGEPPAAAQGHATPRDLAMVGEAQESFRELVLALLGDRGRRAAYLQGAAGREYGEPFLRALERLFFEYLQRLESALPPPDLRQLQEAVWRHASPGPRPRELPILSRYLADMGHAPSGPLPRPLSPAPPPPRTPGPLRREPPPRRLLPRPRLRRLRPLQAPPLGFVDEVIDDTESEASSGGKVEPLPLPRRALTPPGGPRRPGPSPAAK
ncbi:TERF1-interacting nuclear factor 2-like isoform X1 [Dromaius novaehollandiae]|uniref:TERF1-interacting nuclear factor 2-like isoform X1 n=1 Tax=Dromaius novaehollandiae TaxID=8790 RepID=UPI00311F7080